MSIKKIEDYVYDFHKNCAEKQTRNDFWPARCELFKLKSPKFPHITKVCQVDHLCFADFTGWTHRAYGVISCFTPTHGLAT